jgi:tetratricopeptide (TPR) repeat protein
MGERKVTEEAGHWIYRALDVITTLDPKFVRVYEAGGVALVTLVVLVEESNRILEKGIQYNPDYWALPFLLGFNYYFELHDDAKAADYIAKASRLQGAPEYLAQLAARLYVSAREPQIAIDFLAQMYEQTSDENVKSVLERRLKEVVVERDLQLLEGTLSRYRARYRRPPERLEDLVGPGLLRALPREPFGGRYLYDPQTQTVRSSEMKERLKVYEKRRSR